MAVVVECLCLGCVRGLVVGFGYVLRELDNAGRGTRQGFHGERYVHCVRHQFAPSALLAPDPPNRLTERAQGSLQALLTLTQAPAAPHPPLLLALASVVLDRLHDMATVYFDAEIDWEDPSAWCERLSGQGNRVRCLAAAAAACRMSG